MVKVNIISGFLGAGKTTLIKKLLGGAMKDEQVILLENEYGEVGIDGGFMKDSGITVTEMNSGCICCTLVGDFTKAIDELIEKYHPDRHDHRAVRRGQAERHPSCRGAGRKKARAGADGLRDRRGRGQMQACT